MLPLTVLTSLATGLRDDVLRCAVLRRPRLVVVSYDVEDGLQLHRKVFDATGPVARREPVAPINCCLSCTVREDAPEALSLVAHSDRWDEVLLALPPGLDADTLLPVLDPDVVRLDTLTTVVDAVLLRSQIAGSDLLADRGLAASPTDRRSTAALVLSQVEEADVLAVVGLHRLATAEARTLQALLAHLAPLGVQVTIGPGGVGAEDAVGTGRHDPATTADQRERLTALASALCPPDCGVATVLWSADRPLHSGRLSAALPDLLAHVVRSRGDIWLADRPDARVRWESAGDDLLFGDPVAWDQPPGCSLLLTGVGLDAHELSRALDACLATREELAGAPTWPDPFAEALGPAS